ncbi:hypothetical protein APHAL10511_002962 [Amanita phalloides]|nr:hypothetical protein APHAL10511_002962 [Amanita phalloides]
MTIGIACTTNGTSPVIESKPKLAQLDASKLIITKCKNLKPIPPPDEMTFGSVKTDYMLVAEYNPKTGWSAPEIKPYGPLSLDPASSCFQYCPNVFEGMKAYLGPDGTPRLFRPQKNMERLSRSLHRAALPPINTPALLTLLKRLVTLESRWIPDLPGYSMYIRPTVIGTRASLGVAASDSALLYVILCPTGPYFRSQGNGSGTKAISLLAVSEHVRSWPGGTGEFKLGLNYAPGFMPQTLAKERGYDSILWLIPKIHQNDNGEKQITEAGAMNFFAVLKRDDGDIDVITPSLDGTILPGVTRDSCLALIRAHSSPSNPFTIPGLSATARIHTVERTMVMSEVERWAEEGRLLEIFCVGTAATVALVSKIGLDGLSAQPQVEGGERMLVLPESHSSGSVASGLLEALGAIQTGRMQFEDWCMACS